MPPKPEDLDRYKALEAQLPRLTELRQKVEQIQPSKGAAFCRDEALAAIGLDEAGRRLLWLDVLDVGIKAPGMGTVGPIDLPSTLREMLPDCKDCRPHVLGPPMTQTVPSMGDYVKFPLRPKPTSIAWPDFLAIHPPGKEAFVHGVWAKAQRGGVVLLLPVITVFCEECGGTRRFDGMQSYGKSIAETSKAHPPIGSMVTKDDADAYATVHLTYTCRDCKSRWLEFWVRVFEPKEPEAVWAIKTGQFPPFGPPVPARLVKLISADRSLFLQGKRAEGLGLGIGAFTYYRRVVENQKNQLIDRIREAAKLLDASPEILDKLEWAKENWRFAEAVDDIKDAIPERLKIKNYNPLVLLHKALSGGIHQWSDEYCLERARAIRAVLTELADKLASIKSDDRALQDAVAVLLEPPPSDEASPASEA